MFKRFNELSTREKIVFTAGGALIFLLLYLGLFLLPSMQNISRMKKQCAALSKDWITLQGYVQEYRNLPIDASPPPERVSVIAFLEQCGSQLKIGKITYLKPFSSGKSEGAEIKIDNITGEELTRFLHQIQEAQINITRINVRDNNMDGLWTVKMFLEG
ncbi:MAG: type II secretion system protein GspM [Vulcanimicrobiota bacterium]